jgi:hypothetical protein
MSASEYVSPVKARNAARETIISALVSIETLQDTSAFLLLAISLQQLSHAVDMDTAIAQLRAAFALIEEKR